MYSCQTVTQMPAQRLIPEKRKLLFSLVPLAIFPVLGLKVKVPDTEITSTQTTTPMLGGSYQLFPYLTKFVTQFKYCSWKLSLKPCSLILP